MLVLELKLYAELNNGSTEMYWTIMENNGWTNHNTNIIIVILKNRCLPSQMSVIWVVNSANIGSNHNLLLRKITYNYYPTETQDQEGKIK